MAMRLMSSKVPLLCHTNPVTKSEIVDATEGGQLRRAVPGAARPQGEALHLPRAAQRSPSGPGEGVDPELTVLTPRRKANRPDLLALFGLLGLAVYTVALMAVILTYQLSFADNGFERFMNSETFGVRFLLTLAGTVTEAAWTWLHRREHPIRPLDDGPSLSALRSLPLV